MQGKKKISLCDEESVYKMFNTTYLNGNQEHSSTRSVARYREMLLIHCCQIMKCNFADLSKCKDAIDNTPLHLIAALPGITYDCGTLVKYLLQAGVDPLATNKNGQTFLHVIFGRKEVEWGIHVLTYNKVCLYKNECVPLTAWFTEDRVRLLDLLCVELSQTQMALLVKTQDIQGNTVLHECALASPIEEKNLDEGEIYKQLFKFGANLRALNNFGELALHFALNPQVFHILQRNNPICQRARNYQDETPILFILKCSADLAFSGTPAFQELSILGTVYVRKTIERNVHKALRLLENLMKIFENSVLFQGLQETAWIPDRKGNVTINIILIAIRLASYKLNENSVVPVMAELRLLLVKLLTKILDSKQREDTWMNRPNASGQGFLHVLLDIPEFNILVLIEEAEILQCMEILLKHNVDVNAVDSKGHTPLDIVYKHQDKMPSLYERCGKLLIEKGGTIGNNSGRSQTRKLRSCPKRHFNNAKLLTDPKIQATVVEKYRYFNQKPIGTGAFSNIFVAIKDEDIGSGPGVIQCRAYALKRLDKATINPQEIKREINTLLSISGKCENIIDYHESVEDLFFQYLCLDLMDGDLSEFVAIDGANQILKEDSARSVQAIKEIINGLTFLHEQKFIHRDLKPGTHLYNRSKFAFQDRRLWPGQERVYVFNDDVDQREWCCHGTRHAMLDGARAG